MVAEDPCGERPEFSLPRYHFFFFPLHVFLGPLGPELLTEPGGRIRTSWNYAVAMSELLRDDGFLTRRMVRPALSIAYLTTGDFEEQRDHPKPTPRKLFFPQALLVPFGR